MRQLTRRLGLGLCWIGLLGVGAGFVWADELNENTNWLCTYEDQGAVITGYVGQITGPLQVPEKLGPYTVRSIGSAAFANRTDLTQLIITSSEFRSVGESACQNCEALTNVTWGAGLTTIGANAFDSCVALVDVTFPATLETIGRGAFQNAASLTRVELPDRLSDLGERAFASATKLESVVLGTGLTRLEEATFLNCSALTSVTGGANLLYIGSQAFADCSSLLSYEVPEKVRTLGSEVFQRDKALETLRLPATLKAVGDYAFSQTALKSLSLPAAMTVISTGLCARVTTLETVSWSDHLTVVSAQAFAGATALKSVTFPPTVVEIGEAAFRKASSLRVVRFEGSSAPRTDYTSFLDVPMTCRVYGRKEVLDALGESIWSMTRIDVDANDALALTMPADWGDQFEHFKERFGTDFVAAYLALSGKTDCRGRALKVYDDYVFGTDPTNPESVFRTYIEMTNGVPRLTWSPVLSDEETAKRKYVLHGDVRAYGRCVDVVRPNHTADYNFFVYQVKMR